MTQFTVAIRTYNGADRLPTLLDRLQAQIDTTEIVWEVLVVDNNSTDQTAAVVQRYQATWSAACPLKYIFEPEQGAAISRRRAIQAAQGTFIGFLDDDNLPLPTWVAAAHAFAVAHPQAGAFGSRIRGLFEGEVPPNFEKISKYFAIKENTQQYCYDTYAKGLPAGAGLVIQRQAWLDSVPAQLVLQGPTGSGLPTKSEEIEALHHVRQAGWEIWHNPTMQIEHQIPSQRLERNYLLNFFRTLGLSRHRLRMLQFAPWQRPFMTLTYLISDAYKIIRYFLLHYANLTTDVVTACEMQTLVGSFLSPAYLWQRSLRLKGQANQTMRPL
jgi:glycosyltransferase involved in cell wall biosynthesis